MAGRFFGRDRSQAWERRAFACGRCKALVKDGKGKDGKGIEWNSLKAIAR